MGLKDVLGHRARRPLAAGVALATLALAGCSSEGVAHLKRLGLPEAASDRAPATHDLWIGSWIAAGVIGVLVWGLMVWVIVRYRRSRMGEVPRQSRYNLPMEVMYTAAPFVIIGVLFYYTILTQDKVLAQSEKPQHVVDVVGGKWSWTFNYREAAAPAVGEDVWETGTAEKIPTLYLPVGESVHFNLTSPDVIHSFWVPAFYFKLDVVPGRTNEFEMTPTKEGVFVGKCAELCGTYHSAMLFDVHVVSKAEYEAHLKELAEKGQTGVAKGGEYATTVHGLNPENQEEGK